PHGRRVSCPATAGTGGRAWRVRRRGLPAPPSPWTASTTPAPSCPRTTGSGTGYTWSRTTRSVRHSPAATTRTSTSSSRGGSSTAGVSSNAPFSLTTAAVISLGAVTEAAIRIPTSAVLVQAPRHRGFAGRVRFTRSTPSPEVQALEPWAPDADPSARLSSGGPARRGGPPEAAGGALLRLRPTAVPVDAVCGAGYGQRSEERVDRRDGYRSCDPPARPDRARVRCRIRRRGGTVPSSGCSYGCQAASSRSFG